MSESQSGLYDSEKVLENSTWIKDLSLTSGKNKIHSQETFLSQSYVKVMSGWGNGGGR